MSKTAQKCGHCQKPSIFQCSRCKNAFFCDQECFKKGWKNHKLVCVKKSSLDEGSYEKARDGVLTLERMNIGGLAGTNLNSVIGSFLGLVPATAGKEHDDAQQAFMITDRIPVLRSIHNGSYRLFKSKNNEEVNLSSAIDVLKDGEFCYVEYAVRTSEKKRKTDSFMFHHPGSLAIELQAWCSGLNRDGWNTGLSPFKLFDGNLQYLIGEAELFWPMMINFRNTGTSLPPSAPDIPMSSTWLFREMDRALETKIKSQTLGTTNISSKSLAFIQIAKSDFLQQELDLETVPSSKETLPNWWKIIAQHWDGALIRCGFPGNPNSHTTFRPPCMFFSTPSGCVKTHMGGVCCAWHDPEYPQSLEYLITNCNKDKAAVIWYEKICTHYRDEAEKMICKNLTKKLQAQVDSGELKMK